MSQTKYCFLVGGEERGGLLVGVWGSTHRCQVDVTDHLHNIRYLVSGYNASAFAFGGDLSWHVVLFCLEDGCLMEANGRRMDAHVGKNNTGIIDTLGKP